MNVTRSKNGFTLVEILIAMALIATILSMVYGSFFATSRSAQDCQARISMCQQGRTALDQMARQIRCAYIGTAKDEKLQETATQQKRVVREEGMNYFTGNGNASNGEILHFVTTYGFTEGEKKPTKGLFEVTYRLDRREDALFLNQRRFVGITNKTQKMDWKLIAKDIEYLELEFFDGRKWQRRWDDEDEKKLPSAVRMEIGCRDEDNRQYTYRTVAQVSCCDHSTGTNTETLVSDNKR
ncbi:MAG: prepilin-type N-terminal cleavage/methylation domain-containing protein [Sedimentisphaerales bacterium]|nr:prepilin-type N-terminal cleavage/methylation domain-containing protein [Sedimentisphaerales bacterium]